MGIIILLWSVVIYLVYSIIVKVTIYLIDKIFAWRNLKESLKMKIIGPILFMILIAGLYISENWSYASPEMDFVDKAFFSILWILGFIHLTIVLTTHWRKTRKNP